MTRSTGEYHKYTRKGTSRNLLHSPPAPNFTLGEDVKWRIQPHFGENYGK